MELRLTEWEVTLTGLTDKLSTQLKRMAQRKRDNGAPDDPSDDETLNRAIRARRAGLSFPRRD